MDADNAYVDTEKKVTIALRNQKVRYDTNKRRRLVLVLTVNVTNKLSMCVL